MTTAAVSTAKRRDWRLIIWRVVAGLGALLFLIALPGLLALIEPWVLVTRIDQGIPPKSIAFTKRTGGSSMACSTEAA